jgi:hypothetical protein
LRLEAVLGIFLVVLLFHHGRRFYENLTRPAASMTAQFLGLAGVLGAAFVPGSFFWAVAVYQVMLGLLLFSYLSLAAFRGYRQRRPWAIPFGMSVVFLFLAFS